MTQLIEKYNNTTIISKINIHLIGRENKRLRIGHIIPWSLDRLQPFRNATTQQLTANR